MRVSFIGLGNMGAPLAENILRCGNELTIYARKTNVINKFESIGAKIASEPLELASCDILCSCLPLPEDVLDLAIRKDNIYSKMKNGAVHIEFSTIDPDTANTLKKAACEYGIGYVQSTVSKSPQIAAEGNAPFFVGGDEQALAVALPLLTKIGKPTVVKNVEAACAIKLISNLIGMSTVAIVAEGMRLAKLANMDQNELLSLLLETGAASYQMKTRGPMIAEDDFKARFAIDLAAKDLRLGCAMARSLNYDPQIFTQTLSYLCKAHDEGLGGEDVCALYKVTR